MPIKEEPPYHTRNINRYNLLNSHVTQVTNLNSLCAVPTILRTKLFEEEGHNEVIRPSIYHELVPEVKKAPMTHYEARMLMKGVYTIIEILLNTRELGVTFRNNPKVNNIQESSNATNLDFMEDFARLSIKQGQPQINR